MQVGIGSLLGLLRELFQQYLKSRQGEEPDWEMSRLSQAYQDIGQINEGTGRHAAVG